jgi:hypothetical protein
MIKKIDTNDLESALDEILRSEPEPLGDFEFRWEAERKHPNSRLPGVYIILENERCLFVGSTGERGGHGICQRLYDLYNNQHTLVYHIGDGPRHDAAVEKLRGCKVQWGIEKDPARRNLLEQFAVIRLRPEHFKGDGC